MATVAEILNIASKVSGLRAENAENDIALMALNRAYLRACLDTEMSGADSTYTAVATGDTVAASTIAGAPVLRVQHLRLGTGGQQIPVQQVSRQELQDNRAAYDGVGIPQMYSVGYIAGEVKVDFYPALGVNDIVKMSYLAHPGILTTATTAITYMPEVFHHDILTNAVIASLLERDGKADEAQLWNARSLEGMSRLEEYLGQMGGTANRAYISSGSGRSRYPDAR